MKQIRKEKRSVKNHVAEIEVDQAPLPKRTPETEKKLESATDLLDEIDAIIEEHKEVLSTYTQYGGE